MTTAAPAKRMSRVKALLAEAGTTYAAEAGIRLADKPAPLWQLLVLVNVVSTRIRAPIAVQAARELFEAGGGTPTGMARLTWQQRIDALGRAHYVRYDEGTSTRLGACADLVLQRYGGDLRRLAREADRQRDRVEELLREFPGIGPAGSRISCREAQAVWPFLRPVLDAKALEGAARIGLPATPAALARLVDGDQLAVLAAALVRVDLDKSLANRIVADSGL